MVRKYIVPKKVDQLCRNEKDASRIMLKNTDNDINGRNSPYVTYEDKARDQAYTGPAKPAYHMFNIQGSLSGPINAYKAVQSSGPKGQQRKKTPMTKAPKAAPAQSSYRSKDTPTPSGHWGLVELQGLLWSFGNRGLETAEMRECRATRYTT